MVPELGSEVYGFNGLEVAEEKVDGWEKAGKTKTYKLKHMEQNDKYRKEEGRGTDEMTQWVRTLVLHA